MRHYETGMMTSVPTSCLLLVDLGSTHCLCLHTKNTQGTPPPARASPHRNLLHMPTSWHMALRLSLMKKCGRGWSQSLDSTAAVVGPSAECSGGVLPLCDGLPSGTSTIERCDSTSAHVPPTHDCFYCSQVQGTTMCHTRSPSQTGANKLSTA